MFLELGRVSQELVQEPMRHSTLNRSVFRSNVGVEVLPERTSMTPPLLSVRHGCKTDLCTDTRIMVSMRTNIRQKPQIATYISISGVCLRDEVLADRLSRNSKITFGFPRTTICRPMILKYTMSPNGTNVWKYNSHKRIALTISCAKALVA